jgi:hypothetical protein
VGSALLWGGLLYPLVLNMLTLLQVVGHAAMGPDDFGIVALVAVPVGLILKMLACKVKPCEAIVAGPLKLRQPVLQGLGVALWMIAVFVAGHPVFQSLFLFLAALCLVSGEVIHRAQFYASYRRVGL